MSPSVIANIIARYSLIFLCFLLPFFVLPVSYISVVQGKLFLIVTLLSVTLLSYALGRIIAGTSIFPKHLILVSGLLMPVCYMISAFFSSAPIDSYISGSGSQEAVGSMVLLSVTLVLIGILFSGKNKYALVPLLGLLAGSSIVVAVQVARIIAPTWFSFGGVLSGSASTLVGTWHDLGIFAGFLLIASISLIPEVEIKKWGKSFLAILGVGAFFILALVALPDVWFVLSVIFLLIALYALVPHDHGKRKRLGTFVFLPFSFAVLSAVVGFSTTFYYPKLPSSLQIEHVEVRPSWQATLDMGRRVFSGNQAIFGTGPNTFDGQWAKWKPISVNESSFWNTDFQMGVGLIPTAFLTGGFLGAIAWLAMLLSIFYETYVTRKAHPERRPLYSSLLGGSLFLLWFHITYSPSLVITTIFFILLGLIVALDTHDESRAVHVRLGAKAIKHVSAVALLGIIICAGLASSYYTLRAVVSNVLVAKAAQDYTNGKGIANSLSLIERALVIYPANNVAHRSAVAIGLLKWEEVVKKGDNASTKELQDILKKTIDEGLAAVSADSKDYQNWLSLAGMYQQLANSGVSGAFENALNAYKKAAAINPTNPLPLLNAGYVSLALGDATSAVAYVNAALGLKSDLASGYYIRSQAKAALHEYANATEDAQQAVLFAKDDPAGWYNLGSVLYAANDFRNAALALSKAISLQNDYANAYFLLSLSLARTGEKDAAIEAMQRVVDLNPGNQIAVDALSALTATSTVPDKPVSKKP